MSGNIIPRGELDLNKMYNPGRDLANNVGPLLIRAIEGLRAENRPLWIAELMQRYELAEDDLGNAALSFARGIREVTLDPDKPDPEETLAASGFFDQPLLAQLILTARFGQLCMGLAVHGIKDVSTIGETSPQQEAMDDVVAAATLYADQLARGKASS